MNSSNRKFGMDRNRLYLVAGTLLLVLALFLAFRGGHDGSAPRSGAAAKSAVPAMKPMSAPGATTGVQEEYQAQSKSDETASSANDSFPQVERVLGNQSIPVDQAAIVLRDISRRKDLPEAERLEAMKHGLNLNFKAFAEVVTDPELPLPMAQRYVDELMNHNEDRQGQTLGCLLLMNHRDEETRKKAQELLAFYLGKESLSEQPEELRKVAAEWMEKQKLEMETRKAEEGDRKPEAGNPSSF